MDREVQLPARLLDGSGWTGDRGATMRRSDTVAGDRGIAVVWIGVAIAVGIVVVGGIAGVVYRWNYTRSPQYSLAMAGKAMYDDDWLEFQRYVDVDAVSAELADAAIAAAADKDGDKPSKGVLSAVKPAIEDRAKDSIKDAVESETPPSGETTGLAALQAAKIARVTRVDDTAVAELVTKDKTLELRLKRVGDHWRVTAIENASDFAPEVKPSDVPTIPSTPQTSTTPPPSATPSPPRSDRGGDGIYTPGKGSALRETLMDAARTALGTGSQFVVHALFVKDGFAIAHLEATSDGSEYLVGWETKNDVWVATQSLAWTGEVRRDSGGWGFPSDLIDRLVSRPGSGGGGTSSGSGPIYTPSKGSAEREALMDAARVELGTSSQFLVHGLYVQGDYAVATLEATSDHSRYVVGYRRQGGVWTASDSGFWEEATRDRVGSWGYPPALVDRLGLP